MKYSGLIKCKCGFEFYAESINSQIRCLMCNAVNNIPETPVEKTEPKNKAPKQ